jgi:hypothetical protein
MYTIQYLNVTQNYSCSNMLLPAFNYTGLINVSAVGYLPQQIQFNSTSFVTVVLISFTRQLGFIYISLPNASINSSFSATFDGAKMTI